MTPEQNLERLNVDLDRQLVTCGQLLRSSRDRVSELLSQLAAVTAERDELQEDLAYWMNAPDHKKLPAVEAERDAFRERLEKMQFALEYISQSGMQTSDMKKYASDALAAARQSQEKTP